VVPVDDIVAVFRREPREESPRPSKGESEEEE